jgi:hypothetical protein
MKAFNPGTHTGVHNFEALFLDDMDESKIILLLCDTCKRMGPKRGRYGMQ